MSAFTPGTGEIGMTGPSRAIAARLPLPRKPRRLGASLAAIATVSALVAVPASAMAKAREVVLAPASPWTMRWDDNSCELLRSFGDGDDSVLLSMERFEPGGALQLTPAGERFSSVHEDMRVSIKFGGADAGLDSQDRSATLATRKATPDSKPVPAIVLGGIDAPDLVGTPDPPASQAVAAAADSLALSWPGHHVVLQTGSLGAPFAAMRKCTDDLVRSWGLDLSVQSSLSRRVKPKNSPGAWLVSDDYPHSQARLGKQSLVDSALIVGADGIPTACRIQRSMGDAAFDEVACQKVMARARFEPALDAAGKPVASYFTYVIHWAMP